jgi:hypothetical protein
MQQWYQCPQCGAQVAFGTPSCPNCRTQLNWPTQQQPPPQPPQYQQPQPQDVKKTNKKNATIGCGVLLVIVILLAVGIGTCLGGSEDSETTEVTLNAKVVYDDGQFTITNNDDFAWTDVEFDLNYETWSSGYTYHTNRLDANTIYTVL